MTRHRAALASLTVGLISLGASLVVPLVDDGRSAWSEEQAERYSEVSLRMHTLAFSQPTEKVITEMRELEAEFEGLDNRLAEARSRGANWAAALRTGAAALIVGGLLLMNSGPRASSRNARDTLSG